ncbi:MAG: DUF2779 domain-containing protein [Gammaproteobacteria bacterium]
MNSAKVAKKPRDKSRHGLSKSRLMAYRQCPKRLWLETYRAELADESGAQAVFAFGHEVGEVARGLHPGGHLIEDADLGEALAETERCLAERPRKPLFEATFNVRGTLVRADLLLPARMGYRLVEVKAATSVKPHYYGDVAIQAWVMENAGLPLCGLELAHVNSTFVYPGGGKYKGLLTYEDVAAETKPLLKEVPRWVEDAHKTLAGSEPDIPIGPQCKDPHPCSFLRYCSSGLAEVPYPLTDLHRGGKLITELAAKGYSDLSKVPAKLLTKPRHRMIHHAVNTGEVMVDPAAARILTRYTWPRRYLDFETIQFAVPIWAGTRPYQQIPFQWSCHIETRSGEIEHCGFLSEGDGDPRRAFAESLLGVLGSDGPIFVFNVSFERGRTAELAETFPDLAPALEAALARFVDLQPIVRDHYYHRDQHGSWSLKAVLPTIAPDLDYAELEISEGGMASDAFRALLDPAIEAAEAERLRAALREYCARDTLGLVHIARFLQQEGRCNA